MRSEAILIGDADRRVRQTVDAVFGRVLRVECVTNEDDLLEQVRNNQDVTAVLVSFDLAPNGGLEAVEKIRDISKDLPVILVAESPAPEQVVAAMKMGASDFLVKPLLDGVLRTAVEDAWKRSSASRRKPPAAAGKTASSAKTANAKKDPEERRHVTNRSPLKRLLYEMASSIGPSDTPVLIQGETGSGKEVLARHIHSLSRRAQKPFLKLNCAALPSELVESELFGYERGAFTGAFQRKPGMFELADGGTLLLDEIGDMEFKLQAKLLQVLQDHEFQRLGGKETVHVDVRVIAATHNDLEKSIAAGKFRQDLYYRLNVVSLYVPPLRDCKEDILSLAKALLEKHGAPEIEVTPALQQALLMYSWPGNIRELENIVRKLTVFRDADLIAHDLSARVGRQSLSSSSGVETHQGKIVAISTPILEQVNRAKREAETEAIMAALSSTQWNRKKAAVLLKIDYKSFLYKMKKLGIDDRAAILSDSGSDPDESETVMVAGSR